MMVAVWHEGGIGALGSKGLVMGVTKVRASMTDGNQCMFTRCHLLIRGCQGVT